MDIGKNEKENGENIRYKQDVYKGGWSHVFCI